MKALSVRGDYIFDMISGKKKIEYRTWYTNYRGPLLMCSTVKRVPGAYPGHALCVVDLYDIKWDPKERIYDWLIDLKYVIKPVHVKGQLKLFNVDGSKIIPVKSKSAWWSYIGPKRIGMREREWNR